MINLCVGRSHHALLFFCYSIYIQNFKDLENLFMLYELKLEPHDIIVLKSVAISCLHKCMNENNYKKSVL